ncbi:er membrane protein complex subunit 10 [Anaeramoeba flamelloides]|uniref:ER membrane protein complex subunit 10 n=1 Tax=Anaeramoeba flamelloides TaxID=1746091 RepID=A0ABQ8ZEZ7_9EUKA|nr:er membrane protein complex subunit 10 [Anaeramoeba flamelloides]
MLSNFKIKKIFPLALLCFLCLATYTQSESSSDQITIEHNLTGSWTKRGAIQFVPPSAIKKSNKVREKWIKTQIKNKPLGEKELEMLTDLANKDLYYSIRVNCGLHITDLSVCNVMASVRARDLVRSGGVDQIILHLDDSNNILGIDYLTPKRDQQEGPSKVAKVATFQSFKTNAYISQPQIQPKPILHKGYGKDKSEEKKPQKSFLKKYWFIALPVGLMLCVSMLG